MDFKIFVKIGTKEHLEKMRNEGLIYCNTITYFAELEDDEQRGDPLEAVVEMKYFESGIWYLKPNNDPNTELIKLNIKEATFRKTYKRPQGNIFCMSAFKIQPSEESKSFKFDERFKSWGSHILLIINQEEFLKRIKENLVGFQYDYCYNIVEYKDFGKFNGTKTLFEKDIKYSWQEEWRLIIYTDKSERNDPFLFSIGNISDISEIHNLNITNDFLYQLNE